LSRDARTALAQRLLADTLRYVAPPPPPAFADEILAAVVAERRRREELRMQVRPGATYGAPAAGSPTPGPTYRQRSPYVSPAPHTPPPPAQPQPPAATDGGFQAPR
jgi:hypothetical protein